MTACHEIDHNAQHFMVPVTRYTPQSDRPAANAFIMKHLPQVLVVSATLFVTSGVAILAAEPIDDRFRVKSNGLRSDDPTRHFPAPHLFGPPTALSRSRTISEVARLKPN
ncbi:MAG: hypothetical protein CMJ50_07685, partial [Planctomycetaceae bacterium]|nr:hypothetical protein [Planctomycetaceae bacterium]